MTSVRRRQLKLWWTLDSRVLCLPRRKLTLSTKGTTPTWTMEIIIDRSTRDIPLFLPLGAIRALKSQGNRTWKCHGVYFNFR